MVDSAEATPHNGDGPTGRGTPTAAARLFEGGRRKNLMRRDDVLVRFLLVLVAVLLGLVFGQVGGILARRGWPDPGGGVRGGGVTLVRP